MDEKTLINVMKLHEMCIDLNRKSILNLEKSVKKSSQKLSHFSVILGFFVIIQYFQQKQINKLEEVLKTTGIENGEKTCEKPSD